jgi:pimeloyl-ACP methyl ester carboxylesterase
MSTSIVLVHGAFADSSGWKKVFTLLEKEEYRVTAVQIPLKSLADDIATTLRVVEAEKGDVVLVGHSYGGAVITGAGAGSPCEQFPASPAAEDDGIVFFRIED